MNEIKVSVVIPAYNAERHLRECLESLNRQSLREIEIVMVDDGSTDGSAAICREFVEKNPAFVLIQQENGGSAAARRRGMLAARGEYLGFVDSDDWCEPEMFEKMYSCATENDVDIVFCNCWRDDGETSFRCNKYIRDGYYSRRQIVDEILPRTLAGLDAKGRNHVIRWANYLRLYRRELIVKHNIYNDPRFRRCQDLQLTFEATLHAESYYYLGDEYLYHNRVVKGSQSRGYTKNQWNKLRILIEKLYQDVEEFSEVDLKAQMNLCVFFFATYSIANEGKKCAGLTEEDHDLKIKEILEDSLAQRCLTSIPFEKLSATNKKYYEAIRKKSVRLANEAIKYEKRYHQIQRIKSALLKNRIFGGIYRRLRRKGDAR